MPTYYLQRGIQGPEGPPGPTGPAGPGGGSIILAVVVTSGGVLLTSNSWESFEPGIHVIFQDDENGIMYVTDGSDTLTPTEMSWLTFPDGAVVCVAQQGLIEEGIFVGNANSGYTLMAPNAMELGLTNEPLLPINAYQVESAINDANTFDAYGRLTSVLTNIDAAIKKRQTVSMTLLQEEDFVDDEYSLTGDPGIVYVLGQYKTINFGESASNFEPGTTWTIFIPAQSGQITINCDFPAPTLIDNTQNVGSVVTVSATDQPSSGWVMLDVHTDRVVEQVSVSLDEGVFLNQVFGG